jgi:hypothetical protein
MKYPVLRLKVTVDGVLDLRHPPSQDWVVAFLCQKAAFFAETLKGLARERERDRRWLAMKERERLWLATLRLLLAQDLGGGALAAQAIGYELRRLGAAGLVFPSARSDSHVIMWDGQMLEHRGFNFVDYRGSKLSSQSPPKTLMLNKFPEYPDAVSFRITANRHGTGSWGVRGLKQINGQRFQTSSMALVEIAEHMMRDLCAGKVHPSDYCGDYFRQMGMMFALADHAKEVASVGRFLIPFTPRKPLARYRELAYRSPNWFFTRQGESGMVRLECVRCLEETVKKKREHPPKRCPMLRRPTFVARDCSARSVRRSVSRNLGAAFSPDGLFCGFPTILCEELDKPTLLGLVLCKGVVITDRAANPATRSMGDRWRYRKAAFPKGQTSRL